MTGMLKTFKRTHEGMVDGAMIAETPADKETIREIRYIPFPYSLESLIFLSNLILEQALQKEPEDRDQEGRKIIQGLAILDLEDRQSRREDKDSSDDRKLIHKCALKNGA